MQALRDLRTQDGAQLPSRYDDPAPGVFLFQNTSTETVPPYGVIQISGATLYLDRPALVAVKPTGQQAIFEFNGPEEIAPGSGGWIQKGPRYQIRYSGTMPSGVIAGVSGWDLHAQGSSALRMQVYGAVDSSTCLARLPRVGTAFWRTLSGGINAAASATSPSFAEAELMRFDGTEIRSNTPRIYGDLGNSVLNSIKANVVVQANEIDGYPFVHVEDCAQ